jgi:capsular polysaccharide biosynthesis protein
MIVTLLLAGLGAWVVWEWIISILPLRVPPSMQPICVSGLTYIDVVVLPPAVRVALAATGVVALLHAFARSEEPDRTVIRRRPQAPSARVIPPSRIPDLPDK